jgi:hypothetical protein
VRDASDRRIVLIRGPRKRSDVDRALVHLFRAVLAEDWSTTAASARLWQEVGSAHLLQRMLARVELARADRTSEVADRAALTIRAALRQAGSA